MMYLVAIFCPPLAVLLCGRWVQSIINVGLCCLLILPGIIHAWMVVKEHKADKRMNKHTKAVLKAQK